MDRRRLKRLGWVATVLLSLTWVTVGAVRAEGVVNAIGALDGDWWGTRADIEIAWPQIRDGGFSWARASVQNNPNDQTNDYVEFGWYKDATMQYYPNMHVSRQFGASHFERNYGQVGGTFKYTVLWDDNPLMQCWRVYYNSKSPTCQPSSYNITRVFSGGEASSSQNAIGVSGSLHNEFASANGGGWLLYPPASPNGATYSQVEPGYTVAWLPNQGDWQVYGNN